jgi:cysteine desulfurase
MTATTDPAPGRDAAVPTPYDGPLYLDHNATTPLDPRVRDAMLPYLGVHFGNPSSDHAYGRSARAAVDAARGRVAALLGCEPDEIVFTGSGSEANHLALRGAALSFVGGAGAHGGCRLVTQRTEHPSVLSTCDSLARLHGCDTAYLPVDEFGRVDVTALAARPAAGPLLVTVMHANAETGTIQPVADLVDAARRGGAVVHTDAAQSVGKIPVNVDDLGVDLLTVVGHKIYGPKGVGALYRRGGHPLEPVSYGGGQEYGLRAGTENVAAIVGLGEACRLLIEYGDDRDRLAGLRDLLHERLAALLPGRVRLNGHPVDRLPNTLNVSIDGVVGGRLLGGLPELAASTGSACHSGDPEPSAVLLAMGLDRERARAALRLTLGRWTTAVEVETAAAAIAAAARRTG